MATKAQEATPQPPLGPADARSFRKFVKRLVRSEAEPVLQSLSEEGAVLGKKAITSTFSRAIQKIIDGDNGAHSMTDRSREKIRAFAKSYLLHCFTRQARETSSA